MSKKITLILIGTLVVFGLFVYVIVHKNNTANTSNQLTTQKQSAYKLKLITTPSANSTYPINQPIKLSFDIRDQNNNVIKNFATYQEGKMHFIVIRKDRMSFQDFHPSLDETNGVFTLRSLTFPSDGQYRLFADFTPLGAKEDPAGQPEAETPYKDIQVGNLSKYTPEALGQDVLSSTVNGMTANFVHSGANTTGPNNETFYAGQQSDLNISITKDGQAFTGLQSYLGSLGHLVIFGPNLELIDADSKVINNNKQTGNISFSATFPVSGQYKLYLLTQVNSQVKTFDFNLTVQAMPNIR